MLRAGANLIILCLQEGKSHSFYGHFGDNSYRNVKSLKIPEVDTFEYYLLTVGMNVLIREGLTLYTFTGIFMVAVFQRANIVLLDIMLPPDMVILIDNIVLYDRLRTLTHYLEYEYQL